MAKLNKDIYFLVFEELQEDSKSLFSCQMVNRFNYHNKRSLFIIISCYLFDDIKEFVTNQTIQLPSSPKQSLLFDYFSYCRSFNVNTISSIISIASTLAYNQFFMQQEVYSPFIRKCPELKYFDMKSIKHQIYYFSEAMVRLESLCELKCDTSIDSSYFYGLSQPCQHIQKLIIINMDPKPNHGIVKLIVVQKNLRHFEWKDDFYDNYLNDDPYKEILLALEKKAESLDMEDALFQMILPKFYKLKVLIISGYLFFNEEQLEKLKMQIYHELVILNIECNRLNVISSSVKNSGRSLKKILFSPYNIEYENYNFNESFPNFICKIYENCPSVEYLTIAFSPSKKHFTELEKLLKVCKHLKSLLMIIIYTGMKDTDESFLKNVEELLNVLIRSVLINLKENRFCLQDLFVQIIAFLAQKLQIDQE